MATAVGVALAAALLTPFAAQSAQSAPSADRSDPVRLTAGHIDAFNLVLNADNSVRLDLKEDATGSSVLRTPESVELFVKKEAHHDNLPAAYLPSGAPTSMWYLPLTQDQNLIWPGWDTNAASSYYGADAKADIVVSAVSGPGRVYLWSSDAWGAPKQVLTNSWSFPGTIHQDYLAHVHANWGFTAAGTYKLTAAATVTSKDGTRTSTSNQGTYTFVVEPQAATATSVSVGAVKQVYGKTAKLPVTVSPKQATGTVSAVVGSKTITGTLSKQKASLTLPARSLAPGRHSVTVSYAGVTGKFASSTATGSVTVTKAPASVSATAKPAKVKRGRTVSVSVSVTAAGVTPSGAVTVKLAGQTRKAVVDARGRATVRITVPAKAKPGATKGSVAYGGDQFVSAGTAPIKLQIS